MSGPLAGVRVVEFAGIGPAPFAAMLLAQMGASVTRIERSDAAERRPSTAFDYLDRGRPAIACDLKDTADREAALTVVDDADILIEGFRPGVMERLGLGPADLAARNPRLVYGRVTGWGQTGPLAQEAGHDINYLALTGALHAIGPADGPPAIPLNLIADFGGGAMYLVTGVLAALVEARATGKGRVIDAAMIDGVLSMMTLHFGHRADGRWTDQRGDNRLDGGHPCYAIYRASDGGWLAVGALEPQFYAALLSGLGLDLADIPDRADKANWPTLHERFAAVFATGTRDEWEAAFAGRDACVTPVLSMAEVPSHPHHLARESFSEFRGEHRPRPGAAPRF